MHGVTMKSNDYNYWHSLIFTMGDSVA